MPPEHTSPYHSQQALEKVLQESGAASRDLPNLNPPGWSDALARFVGSILDETGDIIQSIFGSDMAQGAKAGLGAVLEILLYALCLAVAVFVGVSLYRLLQTAVPQLLVRRKSLVEPHEQSEAKLQEEIDAALGEGDLGRASRLLWQLFLLRSHLRLATTPAEFQALHPHRLSPSVPGTLYHIMYSSAANRSEFDLCRKLLIPQEADTPSDP